MTVRIAWPLSAVVCLLLACQAPPPSVGTASGTLAISRDGALLYAVSPDHGTLSVVRADSLAPVAEIEVGAVPSRITVGADDRIWVANRGSRSVSMIERDAWQVAAEIEVGAEPMGLTLSPDGDRLFVATHTGGTIEAIDTTSLAHAWTAHVGDAPRSVAFTDGRLLVTHFKTGRVSILDAATGATSGGAGLNQPPMRFSFNQFDTVVEAGQAADVAVAPRGDRAFVVHTHSRATAINAATFGSRTMVTYYGGDPSADRVIPVVAPGIGTVDVDRGEVELEPRVAGTTLSDAPMPPTIAATDGSVVLGVPTTALVDGTGDWLYVTFQGSDNLAIFSTRKRVDPRLHFDGIYAIVPTGGERPTGIALSPDNQRAYVHHAHSYSISVVERQSGIADPMARLIVTDTRTLASPPEWLTPQIEEGRRLFFSATEGNVTSEAMGGISCASCHPEGRDDGRVWLLPEGPRTTPMLANGFLSQTAPFHWAGEIETFPGFQKIVTERMGGDGLDARQWEAMMAFLESPALLQPDNPHLALDGTMTAEQSRGAELFHGEAGCAACHAGGLLTDNAHHDVGTFTVVHDPFTNVDVMDIRPDLVTPSLRHVFARAPYMHNGEARTLRERIVDFVLDDEGREVHGNVLHLSDADIDALVAYVKTL